MKQKSDLQFIFSQVGKEKYKMIAAVISSVLSSILELFPYVLVYQIVMLVAGGGSHEELFRYLLLTALSAVVYLFFFILSLGLSHYSAYSILHKLRVKAMEHMGHLNLGFFREKSAGVIKKAIDEDIERLELFIAHQIPDVVSSIVTPLFILIFMITLNWRLGLVLLVPMLISFFVQFLMFRGYEKRAAEYNSLLVRLHTVIVEYIHGINLFKAFNLTAKSFGRYADTTIEYKTYWQENARKFSGLVSVYQLLMDSGLLFSVPLGGLLYLTSGLSFSSFILLLLLSSIFMTALRKILTLGSGLSRLLTGAKNVREVLERDIQPENGTADPERMTGKLEFRDVTFRYTDRDVIRNLSLTILPGQTIALVGPSGSGKTTLAMLIGRFWDIESGELFIDDVNIKSIGMNALMANTSFVFQDVFMLNDTVYENIRMGMNATKEQVYAAAQKAQIHEFIETMENGYDTLIGEGSGIKMSGGEKQRISIARAILKDAPIVLLDEVTSYSDIDNESKIQEALRALLKNKTAVIIAHRLYTIKNVDRIVVLDEGQIVQQGAHDQLMGQEGLYQKLWNLGMEV